MGTILRHEVMQAIDTGDPFDLVFITADRRRGTGGAIKSVTNWVKITAAPPKDMKRPRFGQSNTSRAKNPNHYEHKTINIHNPANPRDNPTKVHWRLIQFFNGKRVLQ
jgi:hypothetical protein